MKPILFHIGPFPVYSFGAMIALGLFLSLFLLTRKARRTGFPPTPELASDLVVVTVLSGFFGGRLFYLFENASYYFQNPLKIFALWEGGLIFYGGVAGSLAGLYFFTKAKGISFLKALDFLIPYVALTHAFGRIGCFLNGCCAGKACDLPWAVTVDGARLHPVQLYEAAFNFLLFLYLGTGTASTGTSEPCTKSARFEGQVIGLYFVIYACGRFIFEFFRAANPTLGILTWNQWESLVLFAVGLALSFRGRRPRNPAFKTEISPRPKKGSSK